jgi:hypothetical protein
MLGPPTKTTCMRHPMTVRDTPVVSGAVTNDTRVTASPACRKLEEGVPT